MSQRISWGPLELVVGADPVGPIIGWAAAARVLGISTSTLTRRRTAAGWVASSTPWWADAEDLRAWWVCLVGAPAAPAVEPEPEVAVERPAPRAGRRAVERAALDIDALRRELLGGRRR